MSTHPQDYALIQGQPGLSLTVRATENGDALIHITNHIGAIRPLDGVPAITGTSLKTPQCWKTAQVLLGHGTATPTAPGLFQLPPLGEITVLLLKK